MTASAINKNSEIENRQYLMNYPMDFAKICVILMLSLSSNVKAQSRCDIAFHGILVMKGNNFCDFLYASLGEKTLP